MSLIGKLAVSILGDDKEIKKAFRSIEKETARLEKKMYKTARSMNDIGQSMLYGITLPLAAAGAAVFKTTADFEKAMTESTAIMGDLSEAMEDDMSDAAREVAKETRFGAEQAAQAYYYLASAGLDAAQSIGALPQVAKFAQAGNFDLAQATDLLTDAQSALGMTVKDTAQNMENMNKVSDTLVKANKIANASVQQFSESLTNQAAAAMRTANQSIEEGVAVLAAFADQGIKGQDAGTKYSQAIRYMQQAAINNTDALKKHNVAVFDNNGSMRNMADIITDLENSFEGLSDQQVANGLAEMGFTAKVQGTIKALLGTSDQIKQYQKDLESAAGTTDEVANKQLQNMWDQLGLLKDQLKDVAITLGDELLPIINEELKPILEGAISNIKGLAEKFRDLNPEMQRNYLKWALIAGVAGPILIFTSKIILALKSLLPLLTGARIAIAAIGPLVSGLSSAFLPFLVGSIVIGGILALKNAFYDLSYEQEENLEKTKSLTDEYEELSKKANKTAEEKEKLREVSNDLAKLYPDLIEGINDESGAYEINTKKVLENEKAKAFAESQANARKRIKQINDEIEALEKENEKREQLNQNIFPEQKDVINKARMDLMKIMDQMNMADMIKEDMSLEDFFDIQNTDKFMARIRNLGAEAQYAWSDALAILMQNNENIATRTKRIEDNKTAIKGLNEELENEQEILGTTTFEEYLDVLNKIDNKNKDNADSTEKTKEKVKEYSDEIKAILEDDTTYSPNDPGGYYRQQMAEKKMAELTFSQYKKRIQQKELKEVMDYYNRQVELEKLTTDQRIAYLNEVLNAKKMTTEQREDLEYQLGKLKEQYQQESFQNLMDYYNKQVALDKYTTEQQMFFLEQLVEKEDLTAKQREDIEIRLYNFKKQNSKELIANAFDKYNHLVAMDKLSTEEQISHLQKIKDEYELSADKEREIDEKVFRLKEQSRLEDYKSVMDYYNNQVALERMTVEEQINYLQRILREKELTAEEEETLNQKIFNLKKNRRNEDYEDEYQKMQFLRDQRQITAHEYLEWIEMQIQSEEEYSDRWYQLMNERQNILNSIVQTDMQDLAETSNKLFEDENERIEWLIKQLEALKNSYSGNLLIVDMLDNKITQLKGNITDPPEEQKLNWLENYFVDIGIKTGEAQQIFREFENSISNGLTNAITKGESFIDVLKNMADQIASMIIQQTIVNPFVDIILTGTGLKTAHNGAVVTMNGLVNDLDKYHGGGEISGLKNDEVPLIGQVGERMLSREQNKAFEAGEYGKKEVHHHYNINAVDAASFVQLVQKNPDAITGVVAEDYNRNGVTRKIIKGGN